MKKKLNTCDETTPLASGSYRLEILVAVLTGRFLVFGAQNMAEGIVYGMLALVIGAFWTMQVVFAKPEKETIVEKPDSKALEEIDELKSKVNALVFKSGLKF